MEKKSILLITRYFPPLDATGTSRMYSWAKYLYNSGYSVSILTTSKKGQVVIPYSVDTSKFEVYEINYLDPIVLLGIDKKNIIIQKNAIQSNNYKKKLFSWMTKIYREKMNERMPGRTDPWILPAIMELKRQFRKGIKYDYILSSYGPPSAHIVGFAAKKIFGGVWIADYRDLWIENHVYKGLFPFTILERGIEKIVISNADAISIVSDNWANILKKKFPTIPIGVIENGYDEDEIAESIGNYFSTMEAKYRIVYMGSIYKGIRDPSPLLIAVTQLIDEGKINKNALEILFWGSSIGDLEEIISKHDKYNIAHYCGLVSKKESLNIQKSANALLFLERPNQKFNEAFPAKIYEYMAFDKPIIAIGIPQHGSVGCLIEASGSGIVCERDIEKIKRTIMDLTSGKYKVKKTWELIEQFSRKATVNRLISLFNKEVQSGVMY